MLKKFIKLQKLYYRQFFKSYLPVDLDFLQYGVEVAVGHYIIKLGSLKLMTPSAIDNAMTPKPFTRGCLVLLTQGRLQEEENQEELGQRNIVGQIILILNLSLCRISKIFFGVNYYFFK